MVIFVWKSFWTPFCSSKSTFLLSSVIFITKDFSTLILLIILCQRELYCAWSIFSSMLLSTNCTSPVVTTKTFSSQ